SRRQMFRPGDPLRKTVSDRFENEESIHVTQWFDGTDVPKNFELRHRHVRVKQKFSTRLNAALEGPFLCDLVEREKVNFWGATAVVETNAYFRGTQILVSSRNPIETIYFDPAQPFAVPMYAVDSENHSGVQALVRGEKRDHVVRVYR